MSSSIKPRRFYAVSFVLALLIAEGILQNLSHIDDDNVRKAVQEYIDLCPCYFSDINLIPDDAYSNFILPIPCCRRCSCLDLCVKSCCPDGPSRYLTDDEIGLIKKDTARCRRMQYKHEDVKNPPLKSKAYMTISTCSSWYGNETVTDKCLKGNHAFDFLDDPSEILPVSSNSSIFKNKYCAICNNIDLDKTEFWRIQIHCTSVEQIFTANITELFMAVDSSEECDIFFSPPNLTLTSMESEKECAELVDRCNETGQWMQYDADTERACMSYESAYRGYKNVHCYLCNTGPDRKVDTICENERPEYTTSSFVALLDFRSVDREQNKVSPVRSNRCPQDYEYDSLKEECMRLVCPDYMYINKGECRSLVQSVGVYDVIFTVEPRDDTNTRFTSDSIGSLYSSLSHLVFTILNMNKSKFTEVCQISGFMVLKTTVSALVDSMLADDRVHLEYSDMEYFAMRIQLIGEVDMNLTQEMQTLGKLFQNYSCIPGLSQHIFRFRDIPLDLFELASSAYADYFWRDNPTMNRLLSNVILDQVLFKSLAASVEHVSSGRTIAPIYKFNIVKCKSSMKYHPNPLCPKIELSADEYRLVSDGITITSVKKFLSNNDIEFTQNNSVYVCYKTYMSWANHVVSLDQDGDELKMKPIMVVTVICITFSLISLVITFVVYASFKPLRTLPGLNIMSLVCCLFVTHLLALINGVVKIKLGEMCIAFGIVLHLSLLLSVSWMFVCTFHMAKVFVNIRKITHQNTKVWHSFIRYFAFTVIISVGLVVANIVVSFVRSDNASLGYDDITCYLDSATMVIFTVATPIGLVVIANIAMFVCVVVKVGRVPAMETNKKHERNNIAIFAKLSTITGITWIFGFLYQFVNLEAFAYIFVILNASQGVFIMAAFILNRRILDMVKARYLEYSTHRSTDSFVLHPSNRTYRTDKPHSDEKNCQTKI